MVPPISRNQILCMKSVFNPDQPHLLYPKFPAHLIRGRLGACFCCLAWYKTENELCPRLKPHSQAITTESNKIQNDFSKWPVLDLWTCMACISNKAQLHFDDSCIWRQTHHIKLDQAAAHPRFKPPHTTQLSGFSSKQETREHVIEKYIPKMQQIRTYSFNKSQNDDIFKYTFIPSFWKWWTCPRFDSWPRRPLISTAETN